MTNGTIITNILIEGNLLMFAEYMNTKIIE